MIRSLRLTPTLGGARSSVLWHFMRRTPGCNCLLGGAFVVTHDRPSCRASQAFRETSLLESRYEPRKRVVRRGDVPFRRNGITLYDPASSIPHIVDRRLDQF